MIEAAVIEYIERSSRRPLDPTPWQADRQRRVAEDLDAAVRLFEGNEAYLEVM